MVFANKTIQLVDDGAIAVANLPTSNDVTADSKKRYEIGNGEGFVLKGLTKSVKPESKNLLVEMRFVKNGNGFDFRELALNEMPENGRDARQLWQCAK